MVTCGLACKTFQNQQSYEISHTANFNILESNEMHYVHVGCLKIPPIFSGCYVLLGLSMFKLSMLLKNNYVVHMPFPEIAFIFIVRFW